MDFPLLQVKNGQLLKKFYGLLNIKLEDLVTLCGPYVLTILKIYQRLRSRCTKGRFCLYIATSRRKSDLRLPFFCCFFFFSLLVPGVSSAINSKLLFFSLLLGHRGEIDQTHVCMLTYSLWSCQQPALCEGSGEHFPAACAEEAEEGGGHLVCGSVEVGLCLADLRGRIMSLHLLGDAHVFQMSFIKHSLLEELCLNCFCKESLLEEVRKGAGKWHFPPGKRSSDFFFL